jgi:hypothetical protein
MASMTNIRWWDWLPFLRWRVVAVVDSADEVPKALPRTGAVLVGTRTRPKWVVFDCPCGRGHRIMLNTDKGRAPCWTTTVKGALTISPSVDYAAPAQRCHYFIRNGRVKWVGERKTR